MRNGLRFKHLFLIAAVTAAAFAAEHVAADSVEGYVSDKRACSLVAWKTPDSDVYAVFRCGDQTLNVTDGNTLTRYLLKKGPMVCTFSEGKILHDKKTYCSV